MKYWISCPSRMIDELKKAGVRIESVTPLDKERVELSRCDIPRHVFDVLDALWGEVFWGEEDLEPSPGYLKLFPKPRAATPKRPIAARPKSLK